MEYYRKIFELLEGEDELAVFNQAKEWGILFDIIDDHDNNLIHLAAKRNLVSLAEGLLRADKSNSTLFNGNELNRIINTQNEEEKSPLDLSYTKEMQELIRKYGGKTSSEIDEEFEAMEDTYYSEMDDVSKTQTAHLTSNKMFDAIKLDDFLEFKRLYELDSTKGGLLLHRLIAKNKSGQSFLELAEHLERKETMKYLKNKNEAQQIL